MTKKRKNRSRSVRFSANTDRGRNKGRGWQVFLRYAIWALSACAVVALFVLTLYGLKLFLFVRNPHFRLRDSEITVYGDLTPPQIREKLAEWGIEPRRTNLFEVDLRDLRERLEDWHVLVQRVRIGRRLPGTLVIDVYERYAVAQLLGPNGRLIDGGGLVLPARRDPRTLTLPIITGIPEAHELKIGQIAQDKMIDSALRLLELVDTEVYGRYLKVNLIQLDRSADALKVYLNERRPFREGACIVLPAEKGEMETALQRVHVIIQERLQGNQRTGFINATYKVNINARP
ncbi:MAG: FtsQ-type POTRA domain-containing protein [Candidatus Pacebacteria bacterium]|nr:FtsQ-type POTRA domain-containing protein [Candidatus Paceibacterota bacterium]